MNTKTITQEGLNIAIELLKMEIGELVMQKMRSGNDIPVSRCTITNSEIDALFNDIKKEALTKPAQEWQGLSDDEVNDIAFHEGISPFRIQDIYIAFEQALRIKNGN